MTINDELPLTCQLDRKRLASIDAKLDLALNKIELFGSLDGPVGKLKEEIIKNAQLVESAHMRLNGHDEILKSLSNRQWDIVWKAVAVIASGGGILFALTKVLESVA
jgi:hypothetical protein